MDGLTFLLDGNLSVESLLCALDKWNAFVPKEMYRRVGANKVNQSQQVLGQADGGVHLESPEWAIHWVP